MKELIILKMSNYIRKYINPILLDLERRERNGEEVSFQADKYRNIISGLYDIKSEMEKIINSK